MSGTVGRQSYTTCTQILMDRRLRTPGPQHPTVLTSVLPGSINVTAKEREKREKDTRRFNHSNCVRDLHQLTPGQPVWITDTQSGGTVLSSHSTKQPCIVDGRTGTVMRNKHHLFIFQKSSPHLPHTPSTPPQPSEPTTMGSPERPKYHSPQTLKSSYGHTTRSGRRRKTLHRLDL